VSVVVPMGAHFYTDRASLRQRHQLRSTRQRERVRKISDLARTFRRA
jgi:hypothetical protein